MVRAPVAIVAFLASSRGGTPHLDGPDATIDPGATDVALAIDVTQSEQTGHLLAAGHAFSGAVWFDFRPQAAVESHLFADGHKLGALRYSLQRLLDVPGVSRAAFGAGLPGALAALPELGFLERYQAHGGEVIFNLMGVPAWLGDAGTVFTPHATAICSNISTEHQWLPPADLDLWATEVVQPIAAFITAKFGAGQRFELGNEPTSCTWFGTTDQYLAMYAATVRGVRLADPTAKIGGPSHSTDVEYGGTMNDPAGDARPFLRRLFAFTSSAPTRLPIDFVTLHAYERNPASNAHYHEDQVGTVRSWLAEFGYPANTEIINDEWFYSVYEDQRTQNLDTSHVGAAYVGATMVAFDRAGYDNQSSQTYQDQGPGGPTDVISPVFAGPRGTPRSGYHVFEMLSQLTGTQVSAASDNPWVRVTAFDAPGVTTVFVAAFTPYEQMSLGTALTYLVTSDPSLRATLTPFGADVTSFLSGSSTTIPANIAAVLTPTQLGTVGDAKALFDHERTLRAAWGVGPKRADPLTHPGRALSWRLDVAGLNGLPSKIIHERIDSHHVLDQPKQIALYQELFTASVPIACASRQQIVTALGATHACPALDTFCGSVGTTTTGLGSDPECRLLETYVVEFSTRATMTETQRLLDQAMASAPIQQEFHTEFAAAWARYKLTFDQLYARPDVEVFQEDVTAQASLANGVLTLNAPAEPFSVHLFRIEH